MALTEYQERLEAIAELQKQVADKPEEWFPFIICLPGTYRAYFNLK